MDVQFSAGKAGFVRRIRVFIPPPPIPPHPPVPRVFLQIQAITPDLQPGEWIKAELTKSEARAVGYALVGAALEL